MMKIALDAQGKLALPPRVVRELNGKDLELVSHSASHLLLVAQGNDDEVVLAGQLGEFSVTDLLSMINMFRKTGILRFQLTGGEKAIFLQQGEVVFATSSFPEEELGEVLFSLGKVDRETLDKARQFASSRTTVGKILVEQQVVNSKDLWGASRSQVENIVYNLFAHTTGSFTFLNKTLDDEQIVRLSMSTQNLIMEGLRRIDERGLFMRGIGSLDHRVVVAGAVPDGLPPAEQKLLLALSGQEPLVRDVLRRSGYAEFEGLRLLFQLKEKRLIRFDAVAEVDIPGNFGQILQIFNGALKVLYEQVTAQNPSFSEEVRSFLRNLPQPFSFVFRDVMLRDDGTIDGGRLLSNLSGLGEKDKERLLVDAVNELVYMECLVARRELGAGQSASLLQRVQDVSRRVKEFIGRKT
jgi:Domain of unknown function (DUF4388)